MDLSTIVFETLWAQYPTWADPDNTGYSTVKQAMGSLPGTPCCVQMSCALNRCGLLLPSASWRRANTSSSDPGNNDSNSYYYTLAVDEIEDFLTSVSGEGELVSASLTGYAAISNYLQGRCGILTFRSASLRQYGVPGVFEHTELWNQSHMLQNMSHSLFDRSFVKFWDVGLASGPAPWLQAYMAGGSTSS